MPILTSTDPTIDYKGCALSAARSKISYLGPDDLKKIRVEIDYNFDEFKNILNAEAFKNTFPNGLDREAATVRPPKGYDETNPAIELIKLKSFTTSSAIDSKEILKPNFTDTVLAGFKAMQPYIAFLNRAIEG